MSSRSPLLENRPTLDSLHNTVNSFFFKARPPTPQEFLDDRNGWLPPGGGDNVWEWVREAFTNIIEKSHQINVVSMYGCTRAGKSFLVTLLVYYTFVWLNHLRNVNQFFGVAQNKPLAVFIMSFKYEKVYQIYLNPLYTLFLKSPRCIQVDRQDRVLPEQEKRGMDYFVYSKAALVGKLTAASGVNLVVGNDDALNIIGNDILQAYISEVSWFLEYAGATEETIFRLYTNADERRKATVGRNARLSYTFLDTSANDAESRIENHILKDLSKDPSTYFKWQRRWEIKELRERDFPIYCKTGETFPVCIGDGTLPAKFISADELGDVPENLVLHVPIDAKGDFEKDLVQSIKDIGGEPTSRESKFIQNGQLITDLFDNETLQNIDGLIQADSSANPEKYLWTLLAPEYFMQIDQRMLIFPRAQKEPRWIGIDLAYSVKGDVIGFCMLHKEWSATRNKVMYVIDLAFPIGPGDNGINLEVVQHFIRDLKRSGRLTIKGVAIDKFQSETLKQFLERDSIEVTKHSVDTTIDPYLALFSTLLERTLKSGRNVFLKNNLISLYRAKNKSGKECIDHKIGEVYNRNDPDWEKSKSGLNAKDVSDAVCQAYHIAHINDYIPSVSYEEENARLAKNSADVPGPDPSIQDIMRQESARLGRFY